MITNTQYTNEEWTDNFQTVSSLPLAGDTGLQIRGGKWYFSITFLEISIENKIEG